MGNPTTGQGAREADAPTPNETRQAAIKGVLGEVIPHCLDDRPYVEFDIKFAAGLAAATMYDRLTESRQSFRQTSEGSSETSAALTPTAEAEARNHIEEAKRDLQRAIERWADADKGSYVRNIMGFEVVEAMDALIRRAHDAGLAAASVDAGREREVNNLFRAVRRGIRHSEYTCDITRGTGTECNEHCGAHEADEALDKLADFVARAALPAHQGETK